MQGERRRRERGVSGGDGWESERTSSREGSAGASVSVLSPTKVAEFGSGTWNRRGIRELGVERRDTRPLQ